MAEEKKNEPKIKDVPIISIAKKMLKQTAVLGKGSFGTVYGIAKDKKVYAVKCPNSKLNKTEMNEVINEIKMGYSVSDSLFIVTTFGYCESSGTILAVLELCGPNVEAFLKIRNFRNNDERRAFTDYASFCLIKAAAHMHSKGIVHRDIKPENMLVGGDGYIKLTDHGFSKSIPENVCSTWLGTDIYMAQEIATMGQTNKGWMYDGTLADMWSIGITIMHFYKDITSDLTTKFKIDDNFDQYSKLYKQIIKLKADILPLIKSEKARKIIEWTVIVKAKNRKGASFIDVELYGNYEYKQIQSDLSFAVSSYIKAKLLNPKFGTKGEGCCPCVGPLDKVQVSELEHIEGYEDGALCDKCDKDTGKETFHCANRSYHGELYDLCRECVVNRNRTLKREWKKGKTPL